MRDWLLAGCVYVPAWIIGRLLCRIEIFDPFIVAWVVGCTAVTLRFTVPWLRATPTSINAPKA